jgi:ubiquinone/menaquinone biosynthesis C-methylase UbiE
MALLARLSGLYSHLQNRTFAVYWRARAPGILGGLAPRPDDTLLEIGCGVGLWTSYLTPRVRRLYALDLDPGEIAAARHWKSPSGAISPTAETRFLCASADALPFPPETFSKVLAADVIEHVPDDRMAIREVARVLKPGGRAVVTTLLADRPTYVRRMEFDTHVREYSRDSFVALFSGASLVVERVFFFYYAPTLIARELQVWTESTSLGLRAPVPMFVGAPLRLLTALEALVPAGRPAGIGAVARKI